MTLQRALVLGLIGLVALAGFLTILQIWGVFFDGALFFKLVCTIGVLVLMIGFFLVVKQDFGDHKRLKDQNYLD